MNPRGRAATPLAATIVDRLTTIFPAAADEVRAVSMRAYLRGQFPFLGIPAARQQELAREVLAGVPQPTEADLRAVALDCWALPEREYQYFGCALLRRYAGGCSAGFIDVARELIVAKSWWDTVDQLASHLVGSLVASHRRLASAMDSWLMEEDVWLIRAALLHQLRYRRATDAARLFRYCATRAGHRDFFVRKAIGWALREYAKTDPDGVREFVRANSPQLSALSVREALRNL